MIAAHLTAYRGLLGLAIQGVIKLRFVLLAGRFCFVVGIVVGKSFDLNGASPATKGAFERGTAEARKVIVDEARKSSGAGQGWAYRLTGGAYGVDYIFRAAIANFGLGYNLPQDAVYPSLANDSEGRPFDGNNRYVLHFDKGKLPPVRAFWSVTAYDAEGYFIPNVIDRVAIGDRDKLAVNADGSLDLYLQAESPGRETRRETGCRLRRVHLTC